jgi:hypothetical protein
MTEYRYSLHRLARGHATTCHKPGQSILDPAEPSHGVSVKVGQMDGGCANYGRADNSNCPA